MGVSYSEGVTTIIVHVGGTVISTVAVPVTVATTVNVPTTVFSTVASTVLSTVISTVGATAYATVNGTVEVTTTAWSFISLATVESGWFMNDNLRYNHSSDAALDAYSSMMTKASLSPNLMGFRDAITIVSNDTSFQTFATACATGGSIHWLPECVTTAGWANTRGWAWELQGKTIAPGAIAATITFNAGGTIATGNPNNNYIDGSAFTNTYGAHAAWRCYQTIITFPRCQFVTLINEPDGAFSAGSFRELLLDCGAADRSQYAMSPYAAQRISLLTKVAKKEVMGTGKYRTSGVPAMCTATGNRIQVIGPCVAYSIASVITSGSFLTIIDILRANSYEPLDYLDAVSIHTHDYEGTYENYDGSSIFSKTSTPYNAWIPLIESGKRLPLVFTETDIGYDGGGYTASWPHKYWLWTMRHGQVFVYVKRYGGSSWWGYSLSGTSSDKNYIRGNWGGDDGTFPNWYDAPTNTVPNFTKCELDSSFTTMDVVSRLWDPNNYAWPAGANRKHFPFIEKQWDKYWDVSTWGVALFSTTASAIGAAPATYDHTANFMATANCPFVEWEDVKFYNGIAVIHPRGRRIIHTHTNLPGHGDYVLKADVRFSNTAINNTVRIQPRGFDKGNGIFHPATSAQNTGHAATVGGDTNWHQLYCPFTARGHGNPAFFDGAECFIELDISASGADLYVGNVYCSMRAR